MSAEYIKRKRFVRVYDVPRIIFEEFRIFTTGKKKEESIFLLSRKDIRPELRIFSELDSKKANISKGMICLQVFPRHNLEEMECVFYLWLNYDLSSYGEGRKKEATHFVEFSKKASLLIHGRSEKAFSNEIDKLVVCQRDGLAWSMMAESSFRLIFKAMQIAQRTCNLPNFQRKGGKHKGISLLP